MSLALIQRGAQLDVTPGREISVKLGGYGVEPFGVLLALKSGKMPAHTWTARCVELGIAGAELGTVASPASDGVHAKCGC